MDFQALRKRMVVEQLISREINDNRILDIFYKIERHKFVAQELSASAYADYPLAIGEGQTISQPYIAALMTQALDLKGDEKVLEVGTGSGYQTAILAELVKEVCTVERFEGLNIKAESILKESGYHNIKFKIGDGSLGWLQEAPFERIIITAASSRIPLPLGEQLKENGKMVLPLGDTYNQILTLVEKIEGRLEQKDICACVFVPLVGKYGMQKD